MTSSETQANDPEEAVVEASEPLLFSINFARLAELKRSAIMLLAARRVPTCPSLDLPDTGSVQFEGRSVFDLPRRERERLRNSDVGFIFQFYYLLPELNEFIVGRNGVIPCVSSKSGAEGFTGTGGAKIFLHGDVVVPTAQIRPPSFLVLLIRSAVSFEIFTYS